MPAASAPTFANLRSSAQAGMRGSMGYRTLAGVVPPGFTACRIARYKARNQPFEE